MSRHLPLPALAAVVLLQAPFLVAQAPGPDNFIPNSPPKTASEPATPESRPGKINLLLPNEKSSESVKDTERNPFGKSDEDARSVGGKASNEEVLIQEQLAKLRATGISPGPKGLRVLLGDIVLCKGDTMPPIIKDQSLTLRVGEITSETIELIWVEKKPTGLPDRTVHVAVDLQPTVRRVPFGQTLPERAKKARESKASRLATAVDSARVAFRRLTPGEGEPAAQMAAIQPVVPPPAAAEAPAKTGTPAAPAAPQAAVKKDENPSALAAAPKATGPKAQPAAAEESTPAPATPAATPAIATHETPSAKKAAPPAATAAPEPASWKKAMGLMENLVKLSEAGK